MIIDQQLKHTGINRYELKFIDTYMDVRIQLTRETMKYISDHYLNLKNIKQASF